jgi:hypothetical protein
VGFEPTTNGLKGRCSTTELPTRFLADVPRLRRGESKSEFTPPQALLRDMEFGLLRWSFYRGQKGDFRGLVDLSCDVLRIVQGSGCVLNEGEQRGDRQEQ